MLSLLKIIAFTLVFAQEAQFENNYKGAVDAAVKSKKPFILVDFSATWCPACLKLEHDVLQTEEFKTKYEQFIYLKIDHDWDGSKEFFVKYHVKDMPTLIIINHKGEELERIHGFTSNQDFVAKLDQFLSSDKKTLVALEKKAKSGDAVSADKSGLMAYNSLDYEKAIKFWNKTKDYLEELQLAKINLQLTKKPINQSALIAELEKYISTYPDALDVPFMMSKLLSQFDEAKEKEKINKVANELQKTLNILVKLKELPQSGKTKNAARDESMIEKSELYALKAKLQKYFILLDPKKKNEYSTLELETWGNAVDEARKELRSSKDFGRRITLASLLGQAGRASEADKELWQLQKENPKEYHYPYRRAMIAFQNKNYILAEAQARDALKLAKGPHYTYSAALLAEILESIGKFAEAKKVAIIGVKKAPQNLDPERDAGPIEKLEYLKKIASKEIPAPKEPTAE